MSLYLFILCSNILSQLLLVEEVKGNLHGIKVSKTNPPISHLLYDDDLIITCQAMVTEAEVVKRFFEKYCKWSREEGTPKSLVYCFPKIKTNRSSGK